MTPWKRPWCWERLKAGGEGDNRAWGGGMVSLTWWTWVWVSSGSWWWTEKPGMLHTVHGVAKKGTQLSDWTELNWRQRYTLGEKVWASVVMSRSAVKSQLSRLYRAVLLGLSYIWPVIWFLFPYLICPRTLPNMHALLYSKMGASPETYGGDGITYYEVVPFSFWPPRGTFCTCAVSLLSWGWEICDLLIFHSNKV